jgi:hypothetical protein
MCQRLLSLCFALCFTASYGLSAADQAMEWQAVSFTFPVKTKDGVKETTFKIQLPIKEKAIAIRGIIQNNGSFMEVAHKHNLAVINAYDEGKDRGPSIELLKAAANACKRPEIEFAGAVGIGCSASGRKAAQWAGLNHERSLAVILDHSFAGGVADKPNYDYGNLPVVPGVPMCFTNTHDDLYQGHDRRALHYRWCTTPGADVAVALGDPTGVVYSNAIDFQVCR